MGFILFLIALILLFLLTIINYIFVGTKFISTAKHLDIFGNMEFEYLFNKMLIYPQGYKFGKKGETISSVLGKNELIGALTKKGKVLVWLLNKIEKNHCINSINNNL